MSKHTTPKPHELLTAEQTQFFGAFLSNGGKGGPGAKSELSASGEAPKQISYFHFMIDHQFSALK